MQVSEQVIEIAAVQLVPHRGHQVSSVQDSSCHTFIRRSRPARQRLLLINRKQGRTVQRPLLPVVMANRATCLKHRMPTSRLRIQLRQGSRRRRRVAPGQPSSACKEKQCTRNLHMALFSHHASTHSFACSSTFGKPCTQVWSLLHLTRYNRRSGKPDPVYDRPTD